MGLFYGIWYLPTRFQKVAGTVSLRHNVVCSLQRYLFVMSRVMLGCVRSNRQWPVFRFFFVRFVNDASKHSRHIHGLFAKLRDLLEKGTKKVNPYLHPP